MKVLWTLLLIGIAGCGLVTTPVAPGPFQGVQGSVSIGQGGFERVRILFDEDEAKIKMQFLGSELTETPEADIEFTSIHHATKTPGKSKSVSDLKVQLKSDPNGELTEVRLGQQSLGNGKDGLEKLNLAIREVVRHGPPGGEPDLVIEADGYGGRTTPRLRYEWVVRAIVASTVALLDRGQDKIFLQYVERLSVDPPDSLLPGVKVIGKVRKR